MVQSGLGGSGGEIGELRHGAVGVQDRASDSCALAVVDDLAGAGIVGVDPIGAESAGRAGAGAAEDAIRITPGGRSCPVYRAKFRRWREIGMRPTKAERVVVSRRVV